MEQQEILLMTLLIYLKGRYEDKVQYFQYVFQEAQSSLEVSYSQNQHLKRNLKNFQEEIVKCHFELKKWESKQEDISELKLLNEALLQILESATAEISFLRGNLN